MAKLQVRFFLLPSLVLVCDTVFLASLAQVYYVTPTPPPNSACSSVNSTGDLCQTLAYYAENSETILDDKENVSLLFLEGNHNNTEHFVGEPSCSTQLAIENVTNLTLAGLSSNRVSIGCLLILKLDKISFLVIEKIQFSSTSFLLKIDNVVSSVLISNVSASSIKFGDFRHVKIINSIIFNQFNVIGTAAISEHSRNAVNNFTLPSIYIGNLHVSPGGSIYITVFATSSIEINFQNVNISDADWGIYVQPVDSLDTLAAVFFAMSDCLFYNLSVSEIFIQKFAANITIQNSIFEHSKRSLKITTDGPTSLSVTNTMFQNSSLMVVADYSNNRELVMRNASFSNQTLGPFKIEALYLGGPMNVTLDSCRFHSNVGLVSPVILLSVDVFFIGNTIFSNNTGSTGGAIHMRKSTLWLDKESQVNFVNNSASQVGGAISTTETDQLGIVEALLTSIPTPRKCFYQLNFNPSVKDYKTLIHFDNNSAPLGGSNIYGGSLKSNCTVTSDKKIYSYQYQSEVFEFDSQSLSTVSSTPRRVCLCNESIPQCVSEDFIFYDIAVSPGEQFNLSVALVGNDFGLVPGNIFALSLNKDTLSVNKMDVIQQATSSEECTSLTYSLQVNHTKEEGLEMKFLLSTDFITAVAQKTYIFQHGISSFWKSIENYDQKGIIQGNLLYAPVIVSATILPCPLGFELRGYGDGHLTCMCRAELSDYLKSCVVVNGTGLVYRNGTVWVGTLNSNSSTILAHSLCPFDYCSPDTVGMDLHHPDSQCALNHSGVLCGGCPSNLSLAIGSSCCLHCSDNNYLALLLVFIVAGVVLVLFIKTFDLTVSHGTIVGLIFYANALWINQSIFFSAIDYRSFSIGMIHFFKVFIAWLNLDFGIETCFIKGLDAYWKTWLQFVFPFYLWFIAGLIILVCRYSSRATRFFGNNAVPVLSTLFLLSYVKLLRTLVLVFGLAILQSYGNQAEQGTQTVWLLDGNVPYFGLKHSFLFIMGFLVLVLLWLPYTIVLLFVRPLHKLPFRVVSSSMTRFRPLLDSYTGPLKDKHQHWIGLTLLARVFLAVTAVAFQAVNPSVSITLLGLVSAMLCSLVIQVYKKIYISLLEFFFIFNLVVLCFAYLSTDVPETRALCTCLSTGFSFLLFIAIVCYHLVFLMKRWCFNKNYISIDDNATKNFAFSTASNESSEFVTKTVVGFREAILESSFNDN